jgi:hypothetical protein
LSASRTGYTLIHRNITISVSATHFSKLLRDPQGLLWPEGLDKLIKLDYLITIIIIIITMLIVFGKGFIVHVCVSCDININI